MLSEEFTQSQLNIPKDTPGQHPENPEPGESQHIKEEIKYRTLCSHFIVFQNSKDPLQINAALRDYCVIVAQQQREDFFQNFAENNVIRIMLQKLREFGYASEIVRGVFSAIQYLIKALKRETQLNFVLSKINRVGFIEQKYQFLQEQDAAYYGNFLKLLTRRINEDEKYINLFFNSAEPHFPLLLNLLRFHNCKDIVLQTSAKLSIIEMCGNPLSIIQDYMQNFPFVTFYLLHVTPIAISFMKIIDDGAGVDGLTESLKYMEDFTQNKGQQVLDMYSNSLMVYLGRLLYGQILLIKPKTIERVKHILRLFVNVVLKEHLPLKAKQALFQMFFDEISDSTRLFLGKKTDYIDGKYWMMDSCNEEIKQHCKSIFYEVVPPKSIIKSIFSYIPRTNQSWLFYQLRAISEAIGFPLEIGKKIDFSKSNEDSILNALTKTDRITNRLFELLLYHEDEEMQFYLLKILTVLVPYSLEKRINFDKLINKMMCNVSLSVVIQFYALVRAVKIQIEPTFSFKTNYDQLITRIVEYALQYSWKKVKAKSCINIGGKQNYIADVIRDIESDLVLFAALRHILGSANQQCSEASNPPENFNSSMREFKVQFRLLKQGKMESSYISTVGRTLKFQNFQDQSISFTFILSHLQIYRDGSKLEIIKPNESSSSISTLYFDSVEQAQKICKYIQERKDCSVQTQLAIRDFKFMFFSQWA